jgi:hypothetical protein
MVRSALGALLVVWIALPLFAGEGPKEGKPPQPNVTPVSELLRRSVESPLGAATADLLRAVADLLDKEPTLGPASPALPPVAASPSTGTSPIDPTSPSPAEQCRRLAIRLSYAPAVDIAKAGEEFCNSEQAAQDSHAPESNLNRVVFVPERVSNCLLISGPPKVVDSLTQFVAQLDTRPDMVMVSLCLAELVLSSDDAKAGDSTMPALPSVQEDGAAWLARAERSGRLEILSRPQIMTLDNQPAIIQIGSTAPMVAPKPDTKGPGKGDRSGQTEIGLIVSLTPRISPEGLIVMELDVQRRSVLNGDQESGPIIQKTTFETVVFAKEGQTIVQRGPLQETEDGRRQLIVAVTPRIDPTR